MGKTIKSYSDLLMYKSKLEFSSVSLVTFPKLVKLTTALITSTLANSEFYNLKIKQKKFI